MVARRRVVDDSRTLRRLLSSAAVMGRFLTATEAEIFSLARRLMFEELKSSMRSTLYSLPGKSGFGFSQTCVSG